MAWRTFTLPLLALLWPFSANADPSIPIAYCASINTGTTPGNASSWQSDGRCHDFCFQARSYALAIVQWQTCWCSDYVPDKADQVDTSQCDLSCPGYPSDWCGQTSPISLWGYMTNANVAPSATAGGTSATLATTTSTGQSGVSSSSSTESSTTTDSSTSPTIALVSTVTVGGTVTTITSTPTLSAGSAGSGIGVSSSTNNGLHGGAIAGIVIGVIAGLAFLLIGLFLWLRYKRRQSAEQPPFQGSSSNMTGTPRMGEATMPQGWDSAQTGASRRSVLIPVDPRLDYSKRTYISNSNPSQESINSLQDNEDYSRPVHQPKKVLRVTNPNEDDAV